MSNSTWHPVRIYTPVRKLIHAWPVEVKKELGAVLTRLQKGEHIEMPDVRPMPDISKGACEIRISNRTGSYRTFYVIYTDHGILVFHAFMKKTKATTQLEKKTARARLRAFLEELEGLR